MKHRIYGTIDIDFLTDVNAKEYEDILLQYFHNCIVDMNKNLPIMTDELPPIKLKQLIID